MKTNNIKRVIINADDFGITAGVNRAIIELAKSGRLTSTSVMSNMPHFGEIAKIRESVGAGVHFNLTVGRPVRRAADVRSLVDRHGAFLPLDELLKRMKQKRVDPSEVEAEFEAQVLVLKLAGIAPDHFDSHESLLKYPFFMRCIRRIALRHGITALRTYTPVRFDFRRLASPVKIVKSCYLAVNKLDWVRRGFRVTHASDSLLCFGQSEGEAIAALRRIFSRLPGGVLELGVHPGYCGSEREALGGYASEREAELAALRSAACGYMIEESGVELITFADLK